MLKEEEVENKEEKEEENNSDDQQFSVHEQCLSDRADVILPCLSESPTGKHLNNISASCDHNRIVY